MSRENIQGVDVTRIGKGLYLVNGYRVEKAIAAPGWTMTPTFGSKYNESVFWSKWFPTLSRAKSWIAENRP